MGAHSQPVGALVGLFGSNLPARLKATVLAVQSSIAVAFILFILVTSNPFLRIPDPPFEGRDLNPILQDPGLAIHPRCSTLGYGRFSRSRFPSAIAALIDGRIDAAWARWVRPGRCSPGFPDARHRDGLVLGVLHARLGRLVVLGSGGERLADALARRHGASALRAGDGRNAMRFKVWTILLAILAFSLSLIGTFLVRSGRAHLGARFCHRPDARRLHSGDSWCCSSAAASRCLHCARPCSSREGLFRAGLARRSARAQQPVPGERLCDRIHRHALSRSRSRRLTGEKISVGAPFFNATFAPLFVPLLIAVPFGPLLAWKRGDLLGVAQRLVGAAASA